MRSLYIAASLFLVDLVAASPVPNPTADPDPDPVAAQFYSASLTGVPAKKRDVTIERDDTSVPEAKRELMKRAQSPVSGPNANKCGPTNQVAGVSCTCGTGNDGPCCSIYGWCGSSSWYCGGGCQTSYGTCKTPYLQFMYDADAGDSIWDIVSDNVFDAQVGDGLLYYGATPPGGWPA